MEQLMIPVRRGDAVLVFQRRQPEAGRRAEFLAIAFSGRRGPTADAPPEVPHPTVERDLPEIGASGVVVRTVHATEPSTSHEMSPITRRRASS